MKWPKGKYNGKRIVGFSIKFTIDITYWNFKFYWNFGQPAIVIGPLRINAEINYSFRD